MITALVIFLITYILIGLRQIPSLRIDRPAGALVGAVLMVVFGVLTLDEAFAAVDMRTLLLLLGMMIITAYLRAGGFFELIADRILSLSRTPFQLLLFVTVSSGILSALFVNDTICLLYTPIVLEVTIQLGVNPVPYLLALAMSSNIGSAMTVTGNPQNMLIGTYTQIPYLSFLEGLYPVALIGLAVTVGVIARVYRRELGPRAFAGRPQMPEYRVQKVLLAKALLVSAGVLAAFLLGHSYSLVAAAGATVLLLIARVRTEMILKNVDWTLLLFFSGLFVVMHGVETSGLAAAVIERAGDLTRFSPVGRIAALSAVSAVLSNLVSNVPAVMLLKPLTESLGGDRISWLALAMSSTLAGNLTLIGSVANLIVVQQARKRVDIGFMEYFRAGALITVITLAAGVLVLALKVGSGSVPRSFDDRQRTRASAPRSSEDVSQETVVFPFEATAAYGAETGPALETPGKDRMSVTVTPARGAAGARTYKVVLYCDTEESQRKGLQGFRKLTKSEAAVFSYDPPETVTFWMGSVAYPLDIIFTAPDMTVLRVSRDCMPGQYALYPSGGPVRWVIETAAGSGIREGDRVVIRSRD